MLVKIASLLATIRPLQHFPSLPLTVPGRQDSEKKPKSVSQKPRKKTGKDHRNYAKKTKPVSITKISQFVTQEQEK